MTLYSVLRRVYDAGYRAGKAEEKKNDIAIDEAEKLLIDEITKELNTQIKEQKDMQRIMFEGALGLGLKDSLVNEQGFVNAEALILKIKERAGLK